MKREVHQARKEYPCSAPYGPCNRRILRGQPYTQLSYGPGEKPFTSPDWTVLRACSTCEALPVGTETPGAEPCPAHTADLQCAALAGHYPATPHEFPIGLF